MAAKKSHSFKSDFLGRIANMSLAASPHNALLPLFEAVTNSIQAIEDKFGKDNLSQGKIEIEVLRDEREDAKPRGFVITDNGIGLNEANMESFITADTRHKASRGGRGVGRFMWLKVFNETKVTSTFENDGLKGLSFDFVLRDDEQIRNVKSPTPGVATGTRVTLDNFISEFAAHCPARPSTIKTKIIAHFIAYFVNMNMPQILFKDGQTAENLFDVFSSASERDADYSFEVDDRKRQHKFTLHAFLLPKEFSDDEKGNNAVFYGANNRSVQRVALDNAIGLSLVNEKFVYCGFVEGDALNSIVNQERTHLSWPSELFEKVNKCAIDKSKEFLAAEIRQIRQKQANIIITLRNEHPRFLSIAKDADEMAASLQLVTQSPEEIFLEMSRIALRQYREKKRIYADAARNKLPDLDEKAKAWADKLQSESLSSLAEYVLRRKLLLDVFEDRLRYASVAEKKHQFEEAVHELICPLRQTSDNLDYSDHNLWIVDDSLAFSTYFASDKTLSAMTGGADKSQKEPDITFFDLGLGFHQKGSTDPITIIEFKRPGRDSYTVRENPFLQVREYVDKLRAAGTVRDVNGAEIRQIAPDTPFMCYVIADFEPSLKEVMRQFGPFHRKAGHGSFYKWDEGFNLFIVVSTYKEILQDAKSRHAAFFERLGIAL